MLANLSGRLVQELAQPLVAALRPGGAALLSGVIEEQEAACRDALEAAGGHVVESRAEEAWRLLIVTKKERTQVP